MDKEVAMALGEITRQLNELGQRIDNHLSNRVDSTDTNVGVTSDTLDEVMGEILPPQAKQLEQVAITVDEILTEILPGLISE